MIELAPTLSVDWLQLNLEAQTKKDFKYHLFFTVKLMPYSTRHFKIVEELYRANKRIATVTREPLSPIIAANTLLIKFDNWLLYSVELSSYVNEFLILNDLKFKSISRIDLCCDFQKFKNGLLPSKFIKNYLQGLYLRLGRSSISNAHFKQMDKDLFFNALKFGSNLSDVSIYLYNKTLEMNSVKWKPWIADKWNKAGFNNAVDTWRLEVSIKDCNKLIIDKTTAEYTLLNTLDILKEKNTKMSFNVFREKYFTFVIKDNQAKKNRMKKVNLFINEFSKYTLIEGDKMIDAGRSDKIFIKKLEQVNQDLRGHNFNFNIDIDKLKNDYIAITGLTQWAANKNLLS